MSCLKHPVLSLNLLDCCLLKRSRLILGHLSRLSLQLAVKLAVSQYCLTIHFPKSQVVADTRFAHVKLFFQHLAPPSHVRSHPFGGGLALSSPPLGSKLV